MAPGQSTRDTRAYTSTDSLSPEALYVSDVILLPASVQLSTSLTLHLGLQRDPAGAPRFLAIHVVRQRRTGEGNSSSELRTRSSVPRLLSPVSHARYIQLPYH